MLRQLIEKSGGLVMLAFERNALVLSGAREPALGSELVDRRQYFDLYLTEGLSPTHIAAQHLRLAKVWPRLIGTNATTHLGRPFGFHQQANRQSWADAWAGHRTGISSLWWSSLSFC